MIRQFDPCAMCERFTIKGYDQPAAAGMGRCTGFDNDGEPEKFVRADADPCVLFNAAPNRDQRRRFLEQCSTRKPAEVTA